MRTWIAILIMWVVCPVCAYSRQGVDPYDVVEEAKRAAEATRAKYAKKAEDQREWVRLRQEFVDALYPRKIIFPDKFRKNLDPDFLLWIAYQVVGKEIGEFLVIEDCWHGWHIEAQKRLGYAVVCLKYDHSGGAYRKVDERMKEEYRRAFEEW